MGLTATSHTEQGVVVVTATGDLDIHTADVLRRELARQLDAAATNLAIDIRQVTFMDSTGLCVLIGALKKAKACGGTLCLVNDQPRHETVLRVSGLNRVFAIHPDCNALTPTIPSAAPSAVSTSASTIPSTG